MRSVRPSGVSGSSSGVFAMSSDNSLTASSCIAAVSDAAPRKRSIEPIWSGGHANKSAFLPSRKVFHAVLAVFALTVCMAMTRRVPPTAMPSASSPRTSDSSAASSGSRASMAWPWMSASCFSGGSVGRRLFGQGFLLLVPLDAQYPGDG